VPSSSSLSVSDLITAIAAIAAAAFSGLNLTVTGRREEVKWRREALTEALQTYGHLSFAMTSAAHRAMQLRMVGADEDTLRDLWRDEGGLHDRNNDQLTRIRLLASMKIVRAAEDLHVSDHAVAEIAQASSGRPSEDELARFEAARDRNRQTKQLFLDAARHGLGLEVGTKLDERLWGTGLERRSKI
jgi:hypothetical protein